MISLEDVSKSIIALHSDHLLYLSIDFHCLLQFIYRNAVSLTTSVGGTAQDTNPRRGWLITIYYSRREDLQCTKIGLQVSGKPCGTMSCHCLTSRDSEHQ